MCTIEERNHKIVTVGDNCMDVYDHLGKAFPGGNPVNVAVYFTRLGGKASYVGAVGTDGYGEKMKTSLLEKGVDISRIKTIEGKTAVTKVELVEGNREFGEYDEGVMAAFKLDDGDIESFKNYEMMVSGIWGKIEGDLWRIKEAGIPIAFDFATKLEDPEILKIISNVTYAFFASDDDDTEALRVFMKEMKSKGPEIVVVTLGEKGSLAYDGKRFVKYGIVKCEVVDTMGAGDSYIAGFLMGILQDADIEKCMELGAMNSSVTLTYLGAW